MERVYLKLKDIYSTKTLLFNALVAKVQDYKSSLLFDFSDASDEFANVMDFLSGALFGYFFDDLLAYSSKAEDEEGVVSEIRTNFINRIAYDIAVKLPYWYKKYNWVKELLVGDENLKQTSKMTSSSTDTTDSAGGTLQKTATTPTGVSTGTATDSIKITFTNSVGAQDGTHQVNTDGFADKYTNAQQKFANAMTSKGSRSGTITREVSIDELLKVLEKLPSSFANEISKELQKHFIFDYEGEEQGLYKYFYEE